MRLALTTPPAASAVSQAPAWLGMRDCLRHARRLEVRSSAVTLAVDHPAPVNPQRIRSLSGAHVAMGLFVDEESRIKDAEKGSLARSIGLPAHASELERSGTAA